MIAAAGSGLREAAAAGPSTGTLRVTMPLPLVATPVMAAISEFAKQNAQVELVLVLDDMNHNMIESGFDCAIRMGFFPASALPARLLFHEPRVVVASPDFVGDRASRWSLEELAAAPWIHFLPTPRTLDFHATGQDPRSVTIVPRVSTNSSVAVRELLLGGVGIGRLPVAMVRGGCSPWTAGRAWLGLAIASAARVRDLAGERKRTGSRAGVGSPSRRTPRQSAAGRWRHPRIRAAAAGFRTNVAEGRRIVRLSRHVALADGDRGVLPSRRHAHRIGSAACTVRFALDYERPLVAIAWRGVLDEGHARCSANSTVNSATATSRRSGSSLQVMFRSVRPVSMGSSAMPNSRRSSPPSGAWLAAWCAQYWIVRKASVGDQHALEILVHGRRGEERLELPVLIIGAVRERAVLVVADLPFDMAAHRSSSPKATDRHADGGRGRAGRDRALFRGARKR